MSHRATLKQQNKGHKHGRHRSKGQINNDDGGKIERFKKGGKHKAAERRVDRMNHLKQIRAAKRQESALQKRGIGSAPHVIAVVGICGDRTNSAAVCRYLAPENAEFSAGSCGKLLPTCTFWSGTLKRKVTLVPAPPTQEIFGVLNVCKAANAVVIAMSAVEPPDAFSELCVSSIKSQGVCSVSHVVIDIDDIPPKRRNESKRDITQFATKDFPETRVHVISPTSSKDNSTVLWNIANQKSKPLRWRDMHPYLLAEDLVYTPPVDETSGGTLAVTGHLRGHNLNVNDLVYLPGLGARQIIKIVRPGATLGRPPATAADAMDTSDTAEVHSLNDAVLAEPTPELQQSLESEVPLDPLAGEQTWPTDEEIAEAQAATMSTEDTMAPPPAPHASLVRVPKGTSSYQAKWIVDAFGDDADGSDFDGSQDDGDDMAMDNGSDASMDVAPNVAASLAAASSGPVGESASTYGGKSVTFDLSGRNEEKAAAYDNEMDVDEDTKTRESLRLARDEVDFPDEVDTPLDAKAKDRFRKYRGLQSFRHSSWDPREELPIEYARIFQFQNFQRTRKRVLKKDIGDENLPTGWVEAGTHVRMYIRDVPQEYVKSLLAEESGATLTVFGLLEHENKMSVLHFKLQMHSTFTEPIKSKTKLVFCTGLRKFSAEPIFSQHAIGDKQKFERYFQPGAICIASVFAPIHFPPSPVIVFRETAGKGLELVATGALHSVNPDRMVIKRIRLAGHPFKINKRTSTIRYMFHNPDDVYWFKSVELSTKYGRKGHIKESLGTHGHMKCTFDGQLNAQDTVLMNLYKRVYPKWTYAEST
eukprot:m.205463 g.205463  ORF g.205463 m.205463 type:complete len:815 (-) comp18879_c1_seq1:424-2868(-)